MNETKETHNLKREKLVNAMLTPIDFTLGSANAALKMAGAYDPAKKWIYELVKKGLRGQFELLNDLDVEGVENVPKMGGAVLASNHQSWLDVQVLVASCPRPVHFVAKEMFREWPVLRHLIELSESVFISRKGGGANALDETIQKLREGWLVAIYPEGTIPGEEDVPRSAVEKETGLLRGKTGAVRLALQAGVPIIPLGVSGTSRALPPEVYPRLEILEVPRPTPITLQFGEPFQLPEDADVEDREKVRELTDDLMKRISSLVDHSRNYIPITVPRPDFPTYEKLGVLVLHGFTSSLKTVDGLIPYLEREGMPWKMPTLRGHGTNYKDLKGVEARHWYEDAETAMLELYNREDVDKVVVVGLSMGGLVGMELGMKHPDKVAGVAPVAAALKFKDPLSPLTPLLEKVASYWPSPESFNDPGRRVLCENYKKFPTDAFLSLYRYSDRIERELPQLNVPIHIVQSKADTVVDPISANIIYENVSSEHRDLTWFMKSGHEMMQDMEADEVFEDLMEFINRFRPEKKAELGD